MLEDTNNPGVWCPEGYVPTAIRQEPQLKCSCNRYSTSSHAFASYSCFADASQQEWLPIIAKLLYQGSRISIRVQSNSKGDYGDDSDCGGKRSSDNDSDSSSSR